MDTELAQNQETKQMLLEQYKFYNVTNRKFLTLFWGTIGFYTLYWSYRNWRLFGDSIPLALLRATLIPYTNFVLFKKVSEEYERLRQSKPNWIAKNLALYSLALDVWVIILFSFTSYGILLFFILLFLRSLVYLEVLTSIREID